MGRPKRIEFAGACSLVSLRGNNRQDLFISNQDRRQFLALLKAYKDRHGLKIYAYSLAGRHVDLLVETPHGDLSIVMQGLGTRYTKYFNGAHNTVGHVFQGRYKAWLVDKETHLADMTRHVHLACVRDGLTDRPWRYQWTSCAAYVEAEHKEPLVDSAAVLRRFGGPRLKQSVRYLQSLKERMKHPDVLPVVGGVAIGGPAFLHKLAAHHRAPASAKAASAEAARRIIAEVAQARGLDPDQLVGRVQWREVTAARREAVRRVWTETRMGVSDIARAFQRTPAAISQLVRAFEEGKY